MSRISRRQFTRSLIVTSSLTTIGGCQSPGSLSTRPPHPGPGPTSLQARWQDFELGVFFHFDMPVFKPGWNHRQYDQRPGPEAYNPTQLNTDQWIETAKSMGAKYAVLTATHGSGFLQWQSGLYPYGVRQSPWRNGKGDLVQSFVDSCRKYGVAPGLYAHMNVNGYLEVDNPGRVNRGRGGDPAKQANYTRLNEQMATELWTRYGPLTEIWFDGGVVSPKEGGPDLVPILQRHQPNAIAFQCPAPGGVRWIGNEDGVAGYPCWSTVEKLNDPGNGNPNGTIWNPGECDVPMPGHGWMWTPDQKADIHPLPRLMDMYYRSVGRNCNLLLNATPDNRGLIPETNLKHYADFGREIRRRFGTPLAETHGNGDQIELRLRTPSKINHVILKEDITKGETVRRYKVEGLVPGNRWEPLCEGLSIGHKRIQTFQSVEVAKVRFVAQEKSAPVNLRQLAVFQVA
jgi:alpha-L-fucosidase